MRFFIVAILLVAACEDQQSCDRGAWDDCQAQAVEAFDLAVESRAWTVGVGVQYCECIEGAGCLDDHLERTARETANLIPGDTYPWRCPDY